MSLAVYVHFPWCLQRCPYCDFATEAIPVREIEHDAYADAVIAEIASRRTAFGRLRAATVFFGGGTPSLWDPRALGRVLAAIRDTFGEPDEVTVECNPTSLDRERATALRDIGVNRLSIGVQSLRDVHLRWLGRLHDAASAVRAVSEAVAVGGLRVSADVMFGMDAQIARELIDDVAQLIGLGVTHVSAYALTIEPATRFGELARKGRLPRLGDDAVAEMYSALESAFDGAGFEHYEVSNYARPGERARHNMAYWRGDAYVGLGAGAVGCAPTAQGRAERYRNGANAREYVAACARGETPPNEREDLDAEILVREGLMLGLRTADGIELGALRERTGLDARAGRERAIAKGVAKGDLLDELVRLRIPRERWLLADGIVSSVF